MARPHVIVDSLPQLWEMGIHKPVLQGKTLWLGEMEQLACWLSAVSELRGGRTKTDLSVCLSVTPILKCEAAAQGEFSKFFPIESSINAATVKPGQWYVLDAA